MINLARRGGRALARLVALGVFLAMIGAAVSALVGWTPSFVATAELQHVTDHLVVEDVFAFAETEAVVEDEGPTRMSTLDGGGPRIHRLGDDPILDNLWKQCADGSGVACDRLFNDSPVGSAYEEFGLTCGDRPQILHCREELEAMSEEAGGAGN